MELKYILLNECKFKAICSNRTFMELKFSNRISANASMVVLIVPLWN